MSDSPGLLDFAIGLVNSVINLPDGQVKFFEEFKIQENCEINLLIKTFLVLESSWHHHGWVTLLLRLKNSHLCQVSSNVPDTMNFMVSVFTLSWIINWDMRQFSLIAMNINTFFFFQLTLIFFFTVSNLCSYLGSCPHTILVLLSLEYFLKEANALWNLKQNAIIIINDRQLQVIKKENFTCLKLPNGTKSIPNKSGKTWQEYFAEL